jgi:V-type H+-transporting ATPase subunit E
LANGCPAVCPDLGERDWQPTHQPYIRIPFANNLLHYYKQTEHDFNLEKQTAVHEAKLAIQEEFLKKEKDREIANRISRSTEIGECRVKKMKLRDDLLHQLLEEAATKCAVVAKGTNYAALVQKLIVQGLIKMEEQEIVIYTRQADAAVVAQVLPAAVQEYVMIMKRESGVTLAPMVTLNQDRTKDLSDETCGGVMLAAHKIICDNTLKARLGLVYEDLLPSIRAILFPAATMAAAANQ